MSTILVEQAFKLHGLASVCIPEDSSAREVVSRLAHEPDLRGVFLVDSRQRFTGMITRAALLRYVRVQLLGDARHIELSGREIIRLVTGARARDLARSDRRHVGVSPTDTLETALDQMIEMEEVIIPVLDSERKVLGDLRLSELLVKVLENSEKPGP